MIEGALNIAEPMDVDEGYVTPYEAGLESGSPQPQKEGDPAALSA